MALTNMGALLMRVILSLLIAAALLLAGTGAYYFADQRYLQRLSLQWPMASDAAREIVLGPLDAQGQWVHALPLPYPLPAHRYASFHVQRTDTHVPVQLFLLIDSEHHASPHAYPLRQHDLNKYRQTLHPLLETTERITGLALAIQGPPGAQISVHGLRLDAQPMTLWALYRAILDDWRRFEGIQNYTINRIHGGYYPQAVLLPPVLAGALWLLLGVLIYPLLRGKQKHQRLITAWLALGVIIWVALDLRWQWDLFSQHTHSAPRSAGVSWEHKAHSPADVPLRELAQTLKAEGIPETLKRVFIVGSHSEDYLALRLRWHLLPHPVALVYPEQPLQQDDGVILLPTQQHLRYEAGAQPAYGHLYHRHRETHTPVRQLLTSPAGSVFKVIE